MVCWMGGAANAGPRLPSLQTGDLIFLDLDCGELCDAIEAVTKQQFRVRGPLLSHVGILSRERGRWFVYEAWEMVQQTPLEQVLIRVSSDPARWSVARLKGIDRKRQQRIIAAAIRRLGNPYDADFLTDNGKYYCSEFVAEVFNEANEGQPVFAYRPMYYGGRFSRWRKVWRRYFKERGQAVPVGKPGISPLGIYLSDRLRPITR